MNSQKAGKIAVTLLIAGSVLLVMNLINYAELFFTLRLPIGILLRAESCLFTSFIVLVLLVIAGVIIKKYDLRHLAGKIAVILLIAGSVLLVMNLINYAELFFTLRSLIGVLLFTSFIVLVMFVIAGVIIIIYDLRHLPREYTDTAHSV
ncbi:MAG: hypothetical protein FWH37_00425 [Candidatus Bathyarchaeota archaeon]|nr:hypothetical protein [Candidatus Termiticorpusculum sp.]